MTMIFELHSASVYGPAIIGRQNSSSTNILIEGLSSTQPRVKFKFAKILRIVSKEKPKLLYPRFEFFANLLDSPNSILKWNAIDIIGNLVAVDLDNKFESLFPRFYGLLNEGSLITCAHVIECSPQIIKARPAWETEITQKLLRVGEILLPTEECRNILKGKVIAAFSSYANHSEKKEIMIRFAEGQVNNTRPATKKKAEQFLLKFSGLRYYQE